VFLGMGGKTLIDYFLVLVNAYYLLRNLRGTRCIKDLVKKIKHAAKTKEKVENSFWAGWINFHKTPRTRFFGTLVTSTALVLGLNFRFLKFDPFQLLFITIAMLPFVLAVLGLKHAWDTNGKVIAAVLPYTGLVALALLVPGAMPVIGLVVGILPDTFLMSLAMMTIFLGIVAISGIGAMAKSVCTTTREAADIATTMVITEFVVQALIAVAFYMALAFNLIYAPLYYDIQLEVPVATAILCIASLVVFYTMRKRFYFKNLYLVSAPSSTPGTAGNESLGNKDGRDMASVAVDAIRRDRLAVSRGKKAIFALIIVCLAAAEVPLSAAATMQPSSTVSHRQAFSTSQYYYINLAVNAPLNVTFSGGIDSVACLVYDTVITPSTLLESAVASSNFTGQLVFHPNGTRHISVVFTIIDDVDNSSDGTVVVFMQTLPEFRLTGIYFLVAGILSVYALLINRLITGKSGRKERMISGG